MSRTLPSFLLLLILTNSSSFANIRLPSILGSHMVLQQKSDVKLWGWADPNERITIKTDWDTATLKTVGSSGATWMVHLKTPPAGGSHRITISGYNTIVLDDVVFGEVWVCSGQSNMEMNVGWGLAQYNEDVAKATDTSIRFFYIPKKTSPYPQDDVHAQWVVCTPEEMKHFSVAGYFFGRQLREQLNVPVGLINANWGGTPAEVWTPDSLVNASEPLKQAAAKLTPANGWPITPGATWNAMIYPITNYPIAGAIWYQGESNVGTNDTYRDLFTTMIGAWRKYWNKDFPFYFVQIAPFAGYGEGNASALLREAQTQTLSYPGTGMVVTSDLVDNINDIHPKMKKEVGLRLANLALAETYRKKDVVYKSPMYKSMKVEKNKVRLYFDNAPSGFISKNGEPTGFYISGDDRNFVPAQAKIEKNAILVWNKEIKNPVAVRFGFTNYDMPNVFSKEGLPVNLFRTDNWDVVTVKKK